MQNLGYTLMSLIGIAAAGCVMGEEATAPPLSYEEFKERYIRAEPETGRLVYDDDQPLASEEQARELHAAYRRAQEFYVGKAGHSAATAETHRFDDPRRMPYRAELPLAKAGARLVQ